MSVANLCDHYSAYGGIMQVFCVGINLYDYTMALSLQVLKPLAADQLIDSCVRHVEVPFYSDIDRRTLLIAGRL